MPGLDDKEVMETDGQDEGVPIYYDGSKQVPVWPSGESSEAVVEQGLPDTDEWRRHIGANPYGAV